MESENYIFLKKNKLFRRKYSLRLKKFVTKEVTNSFSDFLFDPCLVEKDTTLRDIIIFVEKDKSFWKRIVPFNLPDFIKISKKIKKVKFKDKNSYLELYYRMLPDYSYLLDFPSFHLIKGREGFDISLSFDDILDIPIRLKLSDKRKELRTYTLIKIIYGIFWEVSYYGSPSSKNIKEVKNRLKI